MQGYLLAKHKYALLQCLNATLPYTRLNNYIENIIWIYILNLHGTNLVKKKKLVIILLLKQSCPKRQTKIHIFNVFNRLKDDNKKVLIAHKSKQIFLCFVKNKQHSNKTDVTGCRCLFTWQRVGIFHCWWLKDLRVSLRCFPGSRECSSNHRL